MSDDFRLYSKCETCPRKALFVRKRMVKLPIGSTAKSQKRMCNQCFTRVNKMLETNHV